MKIMKKLKGLYGRIRKSLLIVRNKSKYVNQATYYPETARKSKSEILKDYLWIVWKYGEVEPFYFTYGFDRKEMTRQRMAN